MGLVVTASLTIPSIRPVVVSEAEAINCLTPITAGYSLFVIVFPKNLTFTPTVTLIPAYNSHHGV